MVTRAIPMDKRPSALLKLRFLAKALLNMRSFTARYRATHVEPFVNLCGGPVRIPGYCNIDLDPSSDLMLDVSRDPLPFPDASVRVVICISAINYFSLERAQVLVDETHRVLEAGGIARFGVQDMKALARRYVEGDREFFFQRLANGRERFPGDTLGDKFASWFYGHESYGGPCRYMFDYESLAKLFEKSGFSIIEPRGFRDSRLEGIDLIDNREDQMFFLEALK